VVELLRRRGTARAGAVVGAVIALALAGASSGQVTARWATTGDDRTTTPIKHLVVLFQENVPFDRYFGVYPRALNPPGEPRFEPLPGTPAVDGLTGTLLTANPNAASPHRLPRAQPNVCGSSHGYTAEQRAVDGGRMDRLVEETGNHSPGCDPTLGMGYFDGNTVTALWTYAQHHAISDNFFATTYGPSHLGSLNLVSGQTHGAVTDRPTGDVVDGTMIVNVQPAFEDCPRAPVTAAMTGRNIGDLLNERHVTWGWFSEGFRPTSRRPDGTAVCGATASNRYGDTRVSYDGGDEGFQYYASTANPHHLPPTSVAAIGRADQANHQYDLADLWAAAEHGRLPAVSFVKAAGARQGGGGASDPLDEQAFVVGLVNRLQRLPSWPDTAVVITYDDSDGSYDHAVPPPVNPSRTAADALDGPGRCGGPARPLGGYQGRCGYGPRLPFLIISPWSRVNHVDHTRTDQTSVIRFIEDNWQLGRIGDGSFDVLAGPLTGMFDLNRHHDAPLVLDPESGLPAPRQADGVTGAGRQVTPTSRHSLQALPAG
jgi:phospholipase C